MDKKKLMDDVAKTAFENRIEIGTVFAKAGLSSNITRRYKDGIIPTLPTIARIEKALKELCGDS